MSKSIIIGYSGHAYVAIEAAASNGLLFTHYCEKEHKQQNPYNLTFLGPETEEVLKDHEWFVGVGNNRIRRKIIERFGKANLVNCIHASSHIATIAKIGKGVLVAAGAIVNPLAVIGDGVICNTGSIIEHECQIGDFSHIAPGAVLAGNVHVGAGTFIGANAVIKEGVRIGNNVVVGAGSVVLRDITDGEVVVGNPAKSIRKK